MNVRVASQLSEQLKTYNSRKLGNSEKIFEMTGINGKCLAANHKHILMVVQESFEKSPVKHSIEKPILLYVVNLAATFCPWL